jgi:hypothetical protein
MADTNPGDLLPATNSAGTSASFAAEFAIRDRFPATTWVDPVYAGILVNFIHRSVFAPLDPYEQAYLGYLPNKSHGGMDEQSFRWLMALTWSFRRRIFQLERLAQVPKSEIPQSPSRSTTPAPYRSKTVDANSSKEEINIRAKSEAELGEIQKTPIQEANGCKPELKPGEIMRVPGAER